MSFTSTDRAIEPFKLVGQSFSQVGAIYLPLVLLATPAPILSIAQILTSKVTITKGQILSEPTLLSNIFTLLGLIISIILSGTVMYFIYRYLKDGTLDLSGSFQRGMNKSLSVLLGSIAYSAMVGVGCVLLILPGIYLAVIFAFFLYGIVSEEYSVVDSFKYSARLVQGRWWPVFGSMLVPALFIFPLIIIMGLILAIVGVFLFASGVNPLLIAIIVGLVNAILNILIVPLFNIFFVKLYVRLQETMIVDR